MSQMKMLTPSNLLSLSRVLLLAPIFLALSQNTRPGNLWALFFMGLAVLTDYFDGYLARRLNQVSDLGKVLDPVADKICLISVGLFLSSGVRANPLPLWFFLLLLARDSAIVAFGYHVYRRVGVISTSNIWGKTTSGVLATLLIVYTMQYQHNPPWLLWLPARIDEFILWLALSFLLVSTVTYARRSYLLLTQSKSVNYKSRVFSAGPGAPQAPRHDAGP
jgi:CDP-diacylglycerol--glycerol-3-phosphate 3-phosphatidyltransferase